MRNNDRSRRVTAEEIKQRNLDQVKQYKDILGDMVEAAGNDKYLLSIHREEIQRLKEEIIKVEKGDNKYEHNIR